MFKTTSFICLATGALLSTAIPSFATGQQASPAAPTSSSPATNTGVNQRDRSDATLKPTDQPNDRVDIKLAATVRRAIVHDKSLSIAAHNVKLVAANGVITLRGPVANAEEKAKIADLVAGVAGVTKVDNQLDVKN